MWWHLLYQAAMITTALLLYTYYDLMIATMASMGMLVAQVIFLKCRGKQVEKLQWLQIGLLVTFGIPAIWMDNGLMIKLQETISGLVFGVFFLGASLYFKESVVKGLTPMTLLGGLDKPASWLPSFMQSGSRTGHKMLTKTPDNVWKKFDYLWTAELILSSAISLIVALTCSTEEWFYAKYIIGPTLTPLTLIKQGVLMYRASKNDSPPLLAEENKRGESATAAA
jgi:intracellular septation protein